MIWCFRAYEVAAFIVIFHLSCSRVGWKKNGLWRLGSNPSSDACCECGVRFLSLSLSSANEGVHSVPTALNSLDDD